MKSFKIYNMKVLYNQIIERYKFENISLIFIIDEFQ